MDAVLPNVVSPWNGSEFTERLVDSKSCLSLAQCQAMNVAGWHLNVSGAWVRVSYRFLHGGMVAGLE